MNTDWHDLIQRHIDGMTTEAEDSQLDSVLKWNDEVTQLYLRYMNLDVALEAYASSNEAKTELLVAPFDASEKRQKRWLSWRPVAAAVAGLVIGALSATMVWAVNAGKSWRATESELPLVDGSFEQSSDQLPLNLPRKFGTWAGDPVELVTSSHGITPRSGKRMVRFLSCAKDEMEQVHHYASDLWQVIPLTGSGERLVRITAWFNALKPATFMLGAVAGAGDPESSHTLWNARMKDDPNVLAAGKKTLRVNAENSDWHMGELVLQVPDSARILVVDVASLRMPGENPEDGFPGQFVDDISLTISNVPSFQ